ncbi:TetR/AcrR family transcriptional regulator [Thiofilum flexile]|uniref:TetR/AcrR family transcriptional regulator n=1 Tax=Thiofilum flexile TaxID=125627 RepID=UPI000376A963|nr:TetR/AcrR family transcriptional regulator [Thiofilum flexile]
MSPPRAYLPADKQRKREEILNAAQALWTSHSEALNSMAELAEVSGVAKGTLYLYFRSKDEVLLALHERDLEHFFTQVIERAKQPEPMSCDDLSTMLIQAIQTSPTFLPLASLCHGLLERQVAVEEAKAFQQRVASYLHEVVAVLRPQLPLMNELALLQSYAQLLGLWQLLRPSALPDPDTGLTQFVFEHMTIGRGDFCAVLRQSLAALYNGLATIEGISPCQ